jgi:anti-anti-sigma regulatory factor/anti-sigma regulatory factor (Ser/Thr protein kinase)
MITEEQIQVTSKTDAHLSQLASVGQIAAGIAHEVRNPLTAVKGFLQLLEQEGKHEYIDIAQTELENALITLNNLLQVSKPDLEDEDFQTFNLVVELESILNLFQDKLYDVTIVKEFNDTNTLIMGKKNQFKKAFFNLIKNAIEAIESEGTVTIAHYVSDNEVVVIIRDTGVGIPKEKLSILGTPFYTTKDDGTGMGLTQVFSVIYQHGGNIMVDSQVNVGTTFTIRIPLQVSIVKKGVRKLDLKYEEAFSIKDFLFENRKNFETRLMDEAINVKEKIDDIHKIGNINLLNNAHKLVLFVVEEREHELISFARQEGIAWAKFSLTLAFKLEWVQAIRRTLWDFLYNFDLETNNEIDRVAFYSMEKKINVLIDQFLNYFFISYSQYKDEILDKQRKLVENLSVPIIPINNDVCILPVIGMVDLLRLETIQDKVLYEIEGQHIQTLIMDLSGATLFDKDIVKGFERILEGISMMGCRTIITGLRSEIVKSIVSSGIGISQLAEFKGTLQIALDDVVFNKK